MAFHNGLRKADNILTPTVKMLRYEKKNRRPRVLNRLTISDSVSVVLDSAIASPSLFPDSKALRSESDIFATGDRGSCGVDPSKIENRNLVRVSVVR